MPTIPRRTEARVARPQSLGRISGVNAPGIGTAVELKQFEGVLGGANNVATALLARQKSLKQDRDVLNGSEANLKFKNATNDWFVDAENLRGAETEGITERTNEFMQTTAKEIESGLANEDQIRAFKLSVNGLTPSYTYRAAQFESKSNQQRVRANYDGQINSDVTLALGNYDNPNVFYGFLGKASDAKTARLQLDGVDEKLIEGSVKKLRSNTLSGAIFRITQDSVATGEKWFERAKKDKELTNNDELRIQAMLDRANKSQKSKGVAAESQLLTDKLVEDFGTDLEAQLQEVRGANISPELRDATVRRLKARSNEERAIESETQSQILADGVEGIRSAATYEDADEIVNFYEGSANGITLSKLDNFKKARFETDPTKRKTNPSKFQEAQVNIDKTFQGTATTGEKIRSVDDLIARYEYYSSPPDMKLLIKNFNKGGNISGVTNTRTTRVFKNFTGSTNEEISTDKAVRETNQDFYRFAVSQLAPGEIMTDARLNEIGSKFFSEGISTGFWGAIGFGGDPTYGEALKAGTNLTWLPELRDSQTREARASLQQINAVLSQKGLPLVLDTEENLSEIYKVNVLKLPHRGERPDPINPDTFLRIR